MFSAEKPGEFEPMKVRERRTTKPAQTNGADAPDPSNTLMPDAAPSAERQEATAQQEAQGEQEDQIQYEEDPTSEEGAIHPIIEGRIANWPCFFSLLTHVYNTLSPPFHTPILILAQPCWTAQDRELVTQWVFEKFKTPALSLMDAALAVSYAYATPHATVVDIGFGKCDITTVVDHVVGDVGRASAVPGCGGEAMTQRLLSVLSAKGFTRDMCEQLKKNPICEVLPPGTELPANLAPEEVVPNPAAAASTGAVGSGDGQRESIAAQGGAPRGPGIDTDVGDADRDRETNGAEDDEGVLDVANIVASGKTSEFLARKEKEKADKATARKNAAIEAAVAKQAKLPNSKKARALFQYHERRQSDDIIEPTVKPAAASDGQQETINPLTDGFPTSAETAAAAKREERREERRRARDSVTYVRKETEVGLERFQAASSGILDRIADAIHRVILSVPEANRRSELWDSIIIVGNGSIVRGFKEALIATLNARYLISPNSATIFTSELPSNFTTPVATGANTPQPQQPHHPSHPPSGVNPLLHAATTASLAPPGPSQQQLQMQHYQQYQQQQAHQHQHQSHSSHAQTPTSIKLLRPPEYFPEWKEAGMEEAGFLGAQVAAKVVFVVDQGLSKGFMSRTEYNEVGPQGIHECSM